VVLSKNKKAARRDHGGGGPWSKRAALLWENAPRQWRCGVGFVASWTKRDAGRVGVSILFSASPH